MSNGKPLVRKNVDTADKINSEIKVAINLKRSASGYDID